MFTRVEQLSQWFRLATQPPERLQAFTEPDIRAMLLDDSEADTQTVEDNCSTLSSETSAAPKLGMRVDAMSRLGIRLSCEMFTIDVLIANAIFLPASIFLHPGRDFRW